jgi:UDP-N-acetylglucosamine acyltransferase
MSYKVHPQARVEDGVAIGNGTIISAFCTIYSGVVIGENCYIGPGCIIGGPPEHPGINPMDEGLTGKVYIGNNVRLYGLNTIDSAVENIRTSVNSGCILMKGAHVGHDAYLHVGVTLSCGARVGGHSIIGMHSNCGLNSVIHQKSELAEGTMLGASAFIKGRHAEPYRMFVGVPAKDIGPNQFLIDKLKAAE